MKNSIVTKYADIDKKIQDGTDIYLGTITVKASEVREWLSIALAEGKILRSQKDFENCNCCADVIRTKMKKDMLEDIDYKIGMAKMIKDITVIPIFEGIKSKIEKL